jgi:DNA-binding PadR family transcriptional regulator
MIYPGLRELEDQGLIACGSDSARGRVRRTCRLTGLGEEALLAGVSAWRRFLPVMERLVAPQ